MFGLNAVHLLYITKVKRTLRAGGTWMGIPKVRTLMLKVLASEMKTLAYSVILPELPAWENH